MRKKSIPERPKSRVVVYVRVSSDHQEENYSLGTQEDACRAYATQRGWEIVAVQREVASGAILERPRLTGLRDAIRRGEADVLLVYAFDRLARDQVHLSVIYYDIDKHGGQIVSVTEDNDDSAIGRFLRNTNAFVGELEREKLIERTTRGKRARVAAGKPLAGGKPLYGYQWADEQKTRLVLNPVEAPVVQRIFQEVVSGVPIRRLAVQLDADAIRTPTGRGSHWQASTIQRILKNPNYTGEAVGWCWRQANGTRSQTFDAEGAIPLPAGTVPGLVTKAAWDAAQVILARNKQRSRRNAKDPEAALLRAGYVFCGHCGHSMRAKPTSDGRIDYVCARASHVPGGCTRHGIRANILDAVVWNQVRVLLLQPDVIAHELQRLQCDDPTAADLVAIERALADVNRQRVNLARGLAQLDDPDASAPLVAELQLLAERARTLQAEHERIGGQRAGWLQAQARLDDLTAWCVTVAANLETLSWTEKRLALDALGVRVQVYRTTHDPRYVISADIPLDLQDAVTPTI